MRSRNNPISMQLLRKAARKLGAHPVVPSQDQPVHGDSFWRDNSWRTQVKYQNITFTVLYLQYIAENTKNTKKAKFQYFRFAPPRPKAPLNDGKHNVFDASYFSYITNWSVMVSSACLGQFLNPTIFILDSCILLFPSSIFKI